MIEENVFRRASEINIEQDKETSLWFLRRATDDKICSPMFDTRKEAINYAKNNPPTAYIP